MGGEGAGGGTLTIGLGGEVDWNRLRLDARSADAEDDPARGGMLLATSLPSCLLDLMVLVIAAVVNAERILLTTTSDFRRRSRFRDRGDNITGRLGRAAWNHFACRLSHASPQHRSHNVKVALSAGHAAVQQGPAV